MAITAENFMVDDHCPLGKNRARTMMSLRIPKHSIIREQNTEMTMNKDENTVGSVFRELVFRGRSGFRGLRFLKKEFSRAKRIWI